jgi:hypothetical protein
MGAAMSDQPELEYIDLCGLYVRKETTCAVRICFSCCLQEISLGAGYHLDQTVFRRTTFTTEVGTPHNWCPYGVPRRMPKALDIYQAKGDRKKR